MTGIRGYRMFKVAYRGLLFSLYFLGCSVLLHLVTITPYAELLDQVRMGVYLLGAAVTFVLGIIYFILTIKALIQLVKGW